MRRPLVTLIFREKRFLKFFCLRQIIKRQNDKNELNIM